GPRSLRHVATWRSCAYSRRLANHPAGRRRNQPENGENAAPRPADRSMRGCASTAANSASSAAIQAALVWLVTTSTALDLITSAARSVEPNVRTVAVT